LACFRLDCGDLFDTKLPADDDSVEFFCKAAGHSRGVESNVQFVCFFGRETMYLHSYICSCLYLPSTLACIHVDYFVFVYVNSLKRRRKGGPKGSCQTLIRKRCEGC